jgi:hypothetical protein
MKELQAKRQDDADLATVRERLTSAQRQMAASRAAARTAITNSLRAFRRQPRPTSVPRCSMSELQRPGAVTRTSTSGKQ